MKYVVSWEARQTASEELQARSLQVFSLKEGLSWQLGGRTFSLGGFGFWERSYRLSGWFKLEDKRWQTATHTCHLSVCS